MVSNYFQFLVFLANQSIKDCQITQNPDDRDDRNEDKIDYRYL